MSIFSDTLDIRVRYAETDQMGYVYYGNYAQYLEIGRVEWLRKLGVSYKQMEDSGIMLPVVKMEIHYKTPARYDDILTVHTRLKEMPSARITFQYEIYKSSSSVMIATAVVSLVFINIKTRRPIKCPKYIFDKLKSEN